MAHLSQIFVSSPHFCLLALATGQLYSDGSQTHPVPSDQSSQAVPPTSVSPVTLPPTRGSNQKLGHHCGHFSFTSVICLSQGPRKSVHSSHCPPCRTASFLTSLPVAKHSPFGHLPQGQMAGPCRQQHLQSAQSLAFLPQLPHEAAHYSPCD